MEYCSQMNAKDAFFIYVLEAYKSKKGLSGAEALKELKKTGADIFIKNNFGALHVMSTENILMDIDEFENTKQGAGK